MDYKEIKKLMDDMGESKLSEIEVEFPDGTKIKIKKHEEPPKQPPIPMHDTRMSVVPLDYTAPYLMQSGVPMVSPKKDEKENGNIIKSPMVGTFYSKASPTAESFVKVGSKVKKGDTLCVIESMKLMNEIESEFDGEIAEIYVKDNDIVDYGKPLFRIV